MSSTIPLSSGYSQSKQKRLAEFVNNKRLSQIPGSGQYEPPLLSRTSRVQSASTWSMGKSQRFGCRANFHQPGPAEYTIQTHRGPHVYTMRPKCQLDPNRHKTKPGPGLYTPQSDGTKFKVLSYTMSGTNEVKPTAARMKEINPPGPGEYKDMIEVHYRTLSAGKMDKNERQSFFLKTTLSGNPEPGKYNKKGLGEQNYQPKYSFGTSEHPKPKKNRGPPGPGEYKEEGVMGVGVPRYTMPGRRIDLRPKTGKDAPSCALYSPSYSYVKHSSRQPQIPKQARDGEVRLYKNPPGIGDYNPHHATEMVKQTAPTWRIGSEERPKNQQFVPPTPGPGAHDQKPKVTNEGPFFTMNARPTDFNKKSPGPGSYSPDERKVIEKKPVYSLGKNPRIMTSPANRYVAGPGSHNRPSTFGVGPQFSISHPRVMPKDPKQPGPGSYDHISHVGNINNHSMVNPN